MFKILLEHVLSIHLYPQQYYISNKRNIKPHSCVTKTLTLIQYTQPPYTENTIESLR